MSDSKLQYGELLKNDRYCPIYIKYIIEHKQEGITIQKNNWIHNQAEFENKKIKYNVAY